MAGAGPGDDPLTIDLDSTICETYGLAKEGAQRHNYAGQRGYHPLFAAGTGDVLMCRLRKGRANTARGTAHFLRETGEASPPCQGHRRKAQPYWTGLSSLDKRRWVSTQTSRPDEAWVCS